MSKKIYGTTVTTPINPDKFKVDVLGVLEPAEDDIPKVFITGTIPTTKTDALAEMQYISKTENFTAYLKIKCQGSSSMSYDKKNFTIKLYSDEARDTKLKKNFKDWGHASNKFVLKANYIDHSHERNILCANLWNEVVSSRTDYDNLPEEMRNSPRNGAIDGFPVKVYTNGTYQGIYTWNIGKDDWMWGMDEDNANHVLMCGELNTDGVYAENACNFRTLWSGTDGEHWSVEIGTNSEAVKNSLNALISCVMNTDDETFKATIGNYLDMQSAIDYYLHQYVICGLDGLAKNMLLATYNGTKWICGAYDMDSTFGLWWDGTSFVSAEYRCPEDYQERYSLLWERMVSLFSEEIKARYTELRNTVYSYANMVTKFERFMDTIGKDLYAEDLEVYTGIPSGSTNNIKQIRNYIRDRLEYVDSKIIGSEGEDYLYTLAEATVFDGSTTYIDTGVKLFDTEKDFTIFVDFDCQRPEGNKYGYLISTDCQYGNIEATNLLLGYEESNAYPTLYTNGTKGGTSWDDATDVWGHNWNNLQRIILVYVDGVFSFGKYLKKNDPDNPRYIHAGDGLAYHASNETLIIGATKSVWDSTTIKDFWEGTVNEFRVYNHAIVEEEANAMLLYSGEID